MPNITVLFFVFFEAAHLDRVKVHCGLLEGTTLQMQSSSKTHNMEEFDVVKLHLEGREFKLVILSRAFILWFKQGGG